MTYVHTLPGTTKISCAFNKIREPLEILGDIRTGCTALIQFRFGSDFPEEARNITMLTKCCIKTLSPSAKKTF